MAQKPKLTLEELAYLELPDGQSATFRTDGLTMADGVVLQAALYARFPQSQPEGVDAAKAQMLAVAENEVDLLVLYVRLYCTGWTLHDSAGPIPFTPWPARERQSAMPEAWQRIPDRTFAALSARAQTIWVAVERQRRDPKAESPTAGPSAGEPPTS